MKFLIIFFVFVTFSSTSLAIEIDCEYKIINWNHYGKFYVCKPTITGGIDDRMVTAVSGSHLRGKTNKDVQVIYFYNEENLNVVPTDISKYFTNLNFFMVYGSPIEQIKGDELSGLTKLKYVVLYNLDIEKVPGNLFANNPDIEELGIANNEKLNEFGKGLFKPLKKLKNVSLSRNLCISQTARGPSQIAKLIQSLKKKCGYVEIDKAARDELKFKIWWIFQVSPNK